MVTTKTTAGTVEGFSHADPSSGRTTHVFLGIPYAEPPLGDRRFRAPVPISAWEGARPAQAFGPSAPQSTDGPLAGLVPGMRVGATSEDCLTLNVWAPADPDDALAPVMVWLHGGAFVLGGSSLETYDPTRLVTEQGVVVVSVNYRRGALGFLAPGGSSDVDTNCGLRDQLLALEWVVENVAAFGGDPGRVTLFGESAGAGSVLQLLATSRSDRLFSRAIMQSPGVRQTLSTARAQVVAEAFLTKLGLKAPDTTGLVDVGVDRILAAPADTAAEVLTTVGSMPFHPSVDGDLLTDTPIDAARAGRIPPVPLIAGTTAVEMRLFVVPAMAQLDHDGLVAVVDSYEALVQSTGGNGGDVFAGIATDAMMRLPLGDFLDAYAGSGAAVYSYSFTWRGAASDRDVGACHAIDLPFTFGTIDRAGWVNFVGGDEDADHLSGVMRASWASFAHTGIPEVPGIGPWPQYAVPDRQSLGLGRQIEIANDFLADPRSRCAPITGAEVMRAVA